MMLAVIDYGSGNMGSLRNALEHIDIPYMVTDDPDAVIKSSRIIMPGQGRFSQVMEMLRRKKLAKTLIKALGQGKPYLGICIGLQILFETSEEDPGVEGLGLVKGSVKRLVPGKKIPHLGWNKLLKRVGQTWLPGDYYYFAHSFAVHPQDEEVIFSTTNYYGEMIVSAILVKKVFAVQFHPEKSGRCGLRLLKRFCRGAWPC